MLFLPLILYTGAGFAQLGVKGGMAVSAFRLSYDDAGSSQDIDFRPFLGYEVGAVQYGISNPDIGFQLGVSYTARLSEHLSLHPELYYAQRGYGFELIKLYNTSYRLKVHYLQVPLLLKYALPLDWAVRPGMLLGPYASFRLSANRTTPEMCRPSIVWTTELSSLSMQNFPHGLRSLHRRSDSIWVSPALCLNLKSTLH
jgi:hypothetical protein